jgi:hypothetical protein
MKGLNGVDRISTTGTLSGGAGIDAWLEKMDILHPR